MKMSSIQVEVLVRFANTERMQWQPDTGQSGDHCVAWRVVFDGNPVSSEVVDKNWIAGSWIPSSGSKSEKEIIFTTPASAREVRDNIRRKIANSG